VFYKVFKKSFLHIIFLLSLIFFLINTVNAQYFSKETRIEAEKWADSVIKQLSLEEKIGQFIMASAYSGESENQKTIEWAIRKYNIGSLIFFKGEPTHEVILTNTYQSLSKFPLLIAMDAEWGVGMRLDSVLSFPKQMTYGFTNDTNLVYEMGKAVSYQCNRLGIHIDFAPVIDINNNPKNPVIHLRSFGENKETVSTLGLHYMKGLMENKILSVGKHFPGHGNTDIDSHKDLPKLSKSFNEIEETELYPFKELIKYGLEGMMVAHLQIPALDTTTNLPASLSKKIVKGLLIDSLDFKGLVFTDALNMKGVTKNFEEGNIEAMALLAGNDILVCPQNIAKAVHAIHKAVKDGLLTDSLIDARVRKILIYKYLLIGPKAKYISPVNVTEDLNNHNFKFFKQQVIEQSVTILKNTNNIIPLRGSGCSEYTVVYIGNGSVPSFHNTLKLFQKFDYLLVSSKSDSIVLDSIKHILQEKNKLIFVLTGTSSYNINNFGLKKSQIELINELLPKHTSIIVNFGSPYLLSQLGQADAIIQCTESDADFQNIGAQALMGAIPINGHLPVTINNQYKINDGITQSKITRLKFTTPDELGISYRKLSKIDSIVNAGIQKGAFPGAQLLIAKKGKVFYRKSFGYHTYDQVIKVKNTDIYDVASVTKIAATLLPIMKFYELGIIKLDTKLRKLIETQPLSGYGGATIKEILLHEAGFEAWIPFYKYMIDKNNLPLPHLFSDTLSENFPIQVCDNLFASKSIEDTIWKIIYSTPVKKAGKFVYSDLDFIFLKAIVDKISQQPFDEYLTSGYYDNLGMNNTMFNPAMKVFPDRIPPTEIDNYFRQNIIQAFVHDPAAALFGGVSGHAGLFSNATDLAILMQMFLNKGEYGGDRYFSTSTIDTFTHRQSTSSRRGLGFDKPETKIGEYNPASAKTPASAFGHTGFTGTCVWADPDNQLIFIFLSNRTFPDQNNKLINELKIRQEIQSVIYDILK